MNITVTDSIQDDFNVKHNYLILRNTGLKGNYL